MIKSAVVALFTGVSASAFAALPSGVESSITGSQTDMATAIGLLIGVAVAIWGLKKIYGLFNR